MLIQYSFVYNMVYYWRQHVLIIRTKAILKVWKSGLFYHFGTFSCFWIQILITNTDPDPGEPNPKPFWERLKIGLIWQFWSTSLLLDPDPHSQYGLGSRRAKSQALLKGWKSGLFDYFCQFPCLLDPDPHSQDGYGSRRAKSQAIL